MSARLLGVRGGLDPAVVTAGGLQRSGLRAATATPAAGWCLEKGAVRAINVWVVKQITK
jgi:hypothetical protein